MTVSKEYAEALFSLALEKEEVSAVLQKLKSVSESIQENTEYLDFLASPSIPLAERIKAIEDAFSEFLPEYVTSFMCLLCEKGRITAFCDCVKEFEKLVNAKDKVITARVISAVELTAEEKEKLIEKLSKKSGGHVELRCEIDESIIGGVIVEMNETVMDGSIRHRLRDIKDVING